MAPDSAAAAGDGHRIASTSDRTSVAEGYERWAPIYDHTPNPLLAREQRHLFPVLAGLRSKRILDLACGTGRWLEPLLQCGKSAVGVDCSIAMLRVGAKKSCITGRLARAACQNLPFRAGVFDLAICSFALGHFGDLGSTLRELARVTKPRANVFVSDLHPEAYARGWRVGFRDDRSAVEIDVLPREAEDIHQAFCSNGFASLGYVTLKLGKPERHIFARAGKAHLFPQACQSPAILVCHFRRLTDSTTQSFLELSAKECRYEEF